MKTLTQEYKTPTLTAGIWADALKVGISDSFDAYKLDDGLLVEPQAYNTVKGLVGAIGCSYCVDEMMGE